MSGRVRSWIGASQRKRLIVPIVAFLALVGLGALCVWRIVWPAEQLAAAEQSLRQHELADARSRLDQYLTRWPHDRNALLLAARAAWQAGAHAAAESFLATLEDRFGSTDASRLEWALLGAHQGDFAENEEWLRSIADSNQQDAPAALEALARGYQLASRWPEAQQANNKLIERDPVYAVPFIERSTIRRKLGGPHESELTHEDFRHAVALAPDSAAAHAALAGALMDLGFIEEAMYHYEEVLRLRPADPAALRGLARALADDAKVIAAERRLDNLLAAHPDNVEGLVERGRLALRQGRAGEAEKFLAHATQAAPWHRDGHGLYLVALKELGQKVAAAKCETRVAELKEEDATGARLKLRMQNVPDDLGIQWDLYQWCLRNGEPGDGFACLLEILRRDKRHGPAHAALAEYFERAGQPRRAAQHRTLAAEARSLLPN